MKKYSQLTNKEMSDSGQALTLILIILSLFIGGKIWMWAAAVVLVANMAYPGLMRPFAYLWLNLSHALGTVVSHILMAVMFYLLVLPIGFLRRLMGRDPMALKKWRKGQGSVFVDRNHTFTADDLRNPY